jgi:hypothetical protein
MHPGLFPSTTGVEVASPQPVAAARRTERSPIRIGVAHPSALFIHQPQLTHEPRGIELVTLCGDQASRVTRLPCP